MNSLKHWQYSLLIMLGLTAAITGCKNDSEPDVVTSITSIDPATAPIGGTIAIGGTNFDATAANNRVQFTGGVSTTATSATTTRLVVTVPVGATTGPISLTSGGRTTQSNTSFTIGPKTVVEKQGEISANETWTRNNVYLLRGFVYVKSGATLTIESGTIIKGGGKDLDPSGQNQGGSLIIEQGGKISAVGTATQPIVFTSNRPKGQRNYGDWGGVVLIGKAPHNRPSATNLEGGIRGQMGATNDPADNSGTLQYVRIEFAGIALTNASNSEINGLTLYAVGSGTTIDHIQVSYSGDDSYEWFGGTVNAKYLVAHRGWDDDWDTDWGFTGKVQFGLSLRDPEVADASGSNGFESDNFNNGENAGGTPLALNNGLPLTQPVFANISNFAFTGAPSNGSSPRGTGPYQSGMHLRRNTAISVINSVLVGYPEGIRLEGTTTGTKANLNDGKLELQGVVVANMTTPLRGITGNVGSGATAYTSAISTEEATAYFSLASRKNLISTDVASLLLNATNFSLTAPNFLPQASSPLLVAASAATGGKLADPFFGPAPYRGAFNTENWLQGWTNFDPNNADY